MTLKADEIVSNIIDEIREKRSKAIDDFITGALPQGVLDQIDLNESAESTRIIRDLGYELIFEQLSSKEERIILKQNGNIINGFIFKIDLGEYSID